MPKGDGLTLSVGPEKSIRRSTFGVFLLLAGIAGLGWMTVVPLVRASAARSWTPTPCTILTSALDPPASKDGGGTALIKITYEYSVDVKTYQGSRYQFTPALPTSGRKGKQAVVDANPPGHKTTCFVNPASPAESVLVRDVTAEYLWGLAASPFLIVGGWMIVSDVRARRRIADGANRSAMSE